jgi:hypothetical protein
MFVSHKRQKQIMKYNTILSALFFFSTKKKMTKTTKANNIYGLIVNLPLRMRSFNINIINFMIWGGYLINFNNVFQYFDPPLEQFLGKVYPEYLN